MQAASWWFSSHNSPKCSQIILKFGTVMQCNITYHIQYSFSYSSKNSKKSQKTYFLALLQSFFFYTFLRPMSNAPIFCQMKDLMKIHNRGKFHQHSICGCQVSNFQMFSQKQKVEFQTSSRWLFDHNSPKCCQIQLKFGPVMHCKVIYHLSYACLIQF